MPIPRFTTVSAAVVSVLAATLLASPARATDDRADCSVSQLDTARRMLRAECGTGVAGSASVFCAWYGAVEIYDVQCG
ncbi:MAG: hypothetical protein ACJ8GN_16770 [Longimicrobiaceae bacterium]